MPAVKTKQYLIGVTAGQYSNFFSPQTDQRVHLTVQNTGINTALFRFDNQVQKDGGDIILSPGQIMQWTHPDSCPREALSCYSDAGTTLAVAEGIIAR